MCDGNYEFTPWIAECGKSVAMYRAVGAEEFNSVMRSKKFSCVPDGADVKYFGLDLSETIQFSNMAFNRHVVAVLKIKVLGSVLDVVADYTHCDPFLFKSGTVEIENSNLDILNKAISSIEHIY